MNASAQAKPQHDDACPVREASTHAGDLATRRRTARRNAWLIGAVAFALYLAGFWLGRSG